MIDPDLEQQRRIEPPRSEPAPAAPSEASPWSALRSLPPHLVQRKLQRRLALRRAGAAGSESGVARQVQRQSLSGAAAATTGGNAAAVLPARLRGAVGSVGYYAARHRDFHARYPAPPPSPPTYYMGYGDRYARRFTTALLPTLSAKGQAWVRATFVLLQQAIEDRLDAGPTAFDALEKDDAAFKRFAYATHPKAYLDGGLHGLPPGDLTKIATTPDLGDILTIDGVAQILKTAVGILPRWAGDAGHAVADGAKATWGWATGGSR